MYVDGAKVDVTTATMPTDFYLVSYQFDEKMDVQFNQTDGHWEGAVAECLIYDGKLTESDRQGIEKYLSQKWLAALTLQSHDQ